MTAFYKVHAFLQPSRAANIAAVHKMRKGVARVEPGMLSPRPCVAVAFFSIYPRSANAIHFTIPTFRPLAVLCIILSTIYYTCPAGLDSTSPIPPAIVLPPLRRRNPSMRHTK
jgi:hypothetical protein